MASRVCDRCHGKMKPYVPRFRVGDELLCEGCAHGREGRPLTGKLIPAVETPTMAAAPFIRVGGALIKVAHQSGDGVTIYHCFSGETRYWTREGIKTLAETVGTIQEVLTSQGSWEEAMIHSFGQQYLWKVTLQRNQQIKEVFATADHRWYVNKRSDRNSDKRIVGTKDLNNGDRLPVAFPRPTAKVVKASTFGVAHGVVYGDGTQTAHGSSVKLWGDKDAQLLQYFNDSPMAPVKTPNGVLGQHVTALPRHFKDRPSLSESPGYLLGWLEGYFAADGNVDAVGVARLDSASREDLEFAQLVAARLGIATYDITMKMRQGYGDEPSALYTMAFISSTLPDSFFLIVEHRMRHEAKLERGNPERTGWTVVSVEETDRIEEVFCPRVPSENFVLDGWINTMNCPFCGSGQVIAGGDGTVSCDFCSTTFIVQVQPEKSSMPQTINGTPFQIPGMPPLGQETPAAPGDPAPAEEDENKSFGGDDLSDKVHDPKDGPDDGSTPPKKDDSSGDSKKSDDSGGDKPPWLDKKSGLFLTEEGVALPYDRYVTHLALKATEDREATLHEVRLSNEVG